ncbi:MAG TPA: glycerol kinase [Planctomycetaceae bacterium]|nr:glycerol kinase [Planctomycetaceae bacterium]
MPDFVLAIDQGTTSSRSLVLDGEGVVRGIAQKEFTQHFPKPGWVEHDPEEIWKSQLATMKLALKRAKTSAEELAAISITNQRETVVVWDRHTGDPIHRAIVWQDRRTAPQCDSLRRRKAAQSIQAKTGLVIDAYFAGTKLAWLLDNIPGARKRSTEGNLCFGTIDSWLIWKLTGGTAQRGAVHATDVTNASRTLLMNLANGQWDDQLTKTLNCPKRVLPQIYSCDDIIASTHKSVLGTSVPIAGIAGDQHAALFGQLCLRAGMVKNTYGTGCFMLMNVGKEPKPSQSNLLSTMGWKVGNKTTYALEGSVFVAGAVVQWLRDGLGVIKKSADVEKLATQVTDSGGVFLVPAFTGLGAPHWDSYARGTIAGLTRGSSIAHIARAALESIAYQTADVLDAMRADSGLGIKQLRVDGGAAMNDTLMQFQADILQCPVVRPKVFETTALGAAYLGGLAVGLWKNPSELKQLWEVDREFAPEMKRSQVQELRAGWQKALSRARNWEQPH